MEAKTANLMKLEKQEAALKLEQAQKSKWKIARSSVQKVGEMNDHPRGLLFHGGSSMRRLQHALTHNSKTVSVSDLNRQNRVNALIKESFTGEPQTWYIILTSVCACNNMCNSCAGTLRRNPLL